MSTLTSRVGLFKPAADGSELVNVVTDLNNNLDKIDSWLGATICTSGTRPGSPWSGQIIRESDTAKMYCWSGAAWVQLLHGTANYDNSINLPNVAHQVNIGAGASTGAFSAKRTNSTDLLLAGRVGAEGNDRFSVTQAGGMSWGPGSAATDTNLYRSAANTLKTDDALDVAGTLNATGAATLGATLAVTGNTTLSGDLTVSGIGKNIHAYVSAGGGETRVSTTTLTASAALQASLAANATYKMHLYIPFNGPTSNALKWGWTYPTGLTMSYGGVYYNAGFFGRNYVETDTNLISTTEGTTTQEVLHFAGMVFVAGTAGTLAFNWAQNASSATAITIKKGGFLNLERVA